MKTTEKKVIKIESLRSRKESHKADKLNVCAYCRTSSDHDAQHNSYLAQVNYYTEFIQKNENWEFAGVFADESSGTKIENRVGFQEMMAECRKGNVDMIITKSLTRFARNTVDSLNSIRELKSLGVDVFFQKENMNTRSEQSEQLLSILSAVAQLESNNISDNVKWGKEKRFQDGTSVLSRVPYGYKKGDGDEVLIDEEKVDIVRFIFDEALKGDGTSAIAKKLNEKEIPTPSQGQIWNNTTLHNIIYNPFYKGDVVFQKTFTKDSMSATTKRNHGELPMYLVQNHHDGYLSEKEWEVIQNYKRFRENGRKPRQEIICDELSGNVICRNCGKVMRKESDYRNGKIVRIAYSCRANSGKTCDMKRIEISVIHEKFVEMWNILFQCKEWILVPLLNDLERASLLENESERKEVDEKIKIAEEQKYVVSQRSKNEQLRYDIFLREIEQVEKELIQLKNRKAVLLKERLYQNEISETKELLKFIENSEKPEKYDADLFRQFVQKIYVEATADGGHNVVFLLKNSLEI